MAVVNDRDLMLRWVRGTLIGWFVGLILIIVVAVLADSVGIGGSQSIVGICVGLCVGLAQGITGREWFGSPRSWTIATVGGLGLPFVLGDLLGLMGVSVPYSLVVYVLLGGALAGLFQSRVLASRSIDNRGWILASVIAWALAGAAVMLNDAMVGNVPGFLGLFAFIGVVLFGGVLNGAVTGAALHRALAAGGEDV